MERCNQVSHLTQETIWESNKNTIKITNKSHEVSPFPAGDHYAATKRQIQGIHNTTDPQKKYSLGIVSKNILLEGLYRFHGAFLTLSSDLDQDTQIFGLH